MSRVMTLVTACAFCILLAGCRSEGNIRHLPGAPETARTATAAQLPEFTNSLGMRFARIPAGSFQMGCAPAAGGLADEVPVRQLAVGAFWLGRCEVTQQQWRAVMGSTPSQFRTGGPWNQPSVYNYRGVRMFDADKNPVENISWNDAMEFVRRLNVREGTNAYRLPSETEWEYAARAGTGAVRYAVDARRWPTESSILFFGARGGITFPVGSLPPNPWGLYDMDGNVREWCADVYGPYGVETAADAAALRVVRGSCWLDPQNTRWTQRYCNRPETRSPLIGLRIARSIE